MPSLEDLFEYEEYYSRTVFSVVDREEIVDRVVAVTERNYSY